MPSAQRLLSFIFRLTFQVNLDVQRHRAGACRMVSIARWQVTITYEHDDRVKHVETVTFPTRESKINPASSRNYRVFCSPPQIGLNKAVMYST